MKTIITILIVTILSMITGQLQAQEIFDAVKNNDIAKVRTLVANNPTLVSSKDDAGNTPLHQAATAGSDEIAEYLLSKGADIDAVNAQQNTPLHEAIQSRKENIAVFFIQKGADVSKVNVNNYTPLHRAALTNQMKIGELLLTKGVHIDPKDTWGRTPFLSVARQNGNVEFGKLLLSKGADINVKDNDNLTALNLAAWRGFKDFIDLLLDRGAVYDTSRGRSRQILSSAASGGCLRLFNEVLSKDQSLLLSENFKQNIIRTAIMGGSVEIVNILLSRNIPLNNDANEYGWTPLHYAAAKGHAAMIRFLKENKIDINRRTSSGKSIYNIAEENRQDEVLKAIMELRGDASPKIFPELSGPYLGQKPPVAELVLFAPDIVASPIEDENHSSVSFSPDGKEIYWNMKNKIWMTKLLNDRWTEPAIVPFCGEDSSGYDNPFITPDDRKMFFTSGRTGSVGTMKENIWYVERTSTGWSEPQPVSSEVNAMQLHWSVSVSRTGTLYWSGISEDSHGKNDIFYSKLVNDKYTRPINMGPMINSNNNETCPYIAPDESYIIFSRFTAEGQNFYISYRGKSDTWLSSVKIHDELEGVSPKISTDGKYFFFLGAGAEGIYWMPATFIDALRPKE